MRWRSDLLNSGTVRLLFLSHCSRIYSLAFSWQTTNNHQFLQEVDHTIQLLCFRLHNFRFLFHCNEVLHIELTFLLWGQRSFDTSPCWNDSSLHISTRLRAQRYTWPQEFLLRLPDVDFCLFVLKSHPSAASSLEFMRRYYNDEMPCTSGHTIQN